MKFKSSMRVDRRDFLKCCTVTACGVLSPASIANKVSKRHSEQMKPVTRQSRLHEDNISLFLCGDVMTGRGIDQVLPHPGDPQLYEPYVSTAETYVALAEEVNGPILRPVDFAYIWGDALDELELAAPDVRLINLETAVTRSADYWPGKGIHYRMSPDNMACITAAKIDCCALANNHVLDWGYAGLAETLGSLVNAGIKSAGAGPDIEAAQAPAVIELPGKGRVIVFSLGSETSGIPRRWAASENKPGVNLLDDFSSNTVMQIARQVRTVKQPGDIVVASIHWGGNWGYDVEDYYADFAHSLIDDAGVDVIHGHSSHHPKGLQVYHNKLIIYGSGDFLNDYEGISGYEAFRDDLTLMYFVTVDSADGNLMSLNMLPMQIKRFRLNRATGKDVQWLKEVIDRESRKLGTRIEMKGGHTLVYRFEN
jgi:poly-gamma-glutamate synthesis protein (capsule biosynthesis protein)